jgi:hypothetical protein
MSSQNSIKSRIKIHVQHKIPTLYLEVGLYNINLKWASNDRIANNLNYLNFLYSNFYSGYLLETIISKLCFPLILSPLL